MSIHIYSIWWKTQHLDATKHPEAQLGKDHLGTHSKYSKRRVGHQEWAQLVADIEDEAAIVAEGSKKICENFADPELHLILSKPQEPQDLKMFTANFDFKADAQRQGVNRIRIRISNQWQQVIIAFAVAGHPGCKPSARAAQT